LPACHAPYICIGVGSPVGGGGGGGGGLDCDSCANDSGFIPF